MKLDIFLESHKKVMIYGNEYLVHNVANWVCFDVNGIIRTFENEPKVDKFYGWWYGGIGVNTDYGTYIGSVNNMKGLDWEQSLEKLEEVGNE